MNPKEARPSCSARPPDDAAALIEYCKAVLLPSEFFVTQADEFDLTEEQEREWIERHLDSPGSLVVLAEVDGTVIGLLILNVVHGG